jgi:hypothetical protein
MIRNDMILRKTGVLTLRARESARFPGFTATAVILLRARSCHFVRIVNINICRRRRARTDSKCRFKAYIHICWNPRPMTSAFSSCSGATSVVRSSRIAGGIFSSPFFPGQCASLLNSTMRPPAFRSKCPKKPQHERRICDMVDLEGPLESIGCSFRR